MSQMFLLWAELRCKGVNICQYAWSFGSNVWGVWMKIETEVVFGLQTIHDIKLLTPTIDSGYFTSFLYDFLTTL